MELLQSVSSVAGWGVSDLVCLANQLLPRPEMASLPQAFLCSLDFIPAHEAFSETGSCQNSSWRIEGVSLLPSPTRQWLILPRKEGDAAMLAQASVTQAAESSGLTFAGYN